MSKIDCKLDCRAVTYLFLYPLTCAYVLRSIAVMAFGSSSWDLAGIFSKVFGLSS